MTIFSSVKSACCAWHSTQQGESLGDGNGHEMSFILFGRCSLSALVKGCMGLVLVKTEERWRCGPSLTWGGRRRLSVPQNTFQCSQDEPITRSVWHLTFLYHQINILDHGRLQLVPRALTVPGKRGFCFPKGQYCASVISLGIICLWRLFSANLVYISYLDSSCLHLPAQVVRLIYRNFGKNH